MHRYLTFLTVFFAVSISAQEIITDRPDQTESSSTIPVGALQIEAGTAIIGDGDGEYSHTEFVAPTVLLRYGITNGFELRLFSQVERISDKYVDEIVTYSGFSDLEIGFKGQILRKENINTEIAVMSHLIIPTGSEGITIKEYGVINKISISHVLSDKFGLGYNLGYDKIGSARGAATYSMALGAGIGERWGTYIEPYGSIDGANVQEHNFDAGITFLAKENLQLDLSAGLGLNNNMTYIALGFSWVTKR